MEAAVPPVIVAMAGVPDASDTVANCLLIYKSFCIKYFHKSIWACGNDIIILHLQSKPVST